MTHPASPSRSRSQTVLLRVDVLLLPLLTLVYGIAFYDKAVLGSASIFGVLTDLDLQSGTSLSRYSLATAAFYYGYIVGVLPAAFLAQRLRLNWFLGISIIVWGCVVLLTPAISTWRGLVVQRVFLGILESTVSPGFLLVTRRWYTSREMPIRIGIWYSSTGLFSILSGLINYGLGSRSNPKWQTLFLVPGALTVFLGVITLLLLPPSPSQPPLLRISKYNNFSSEDSELILQKTREEMLSREQREWKWSQVVEGLLDVKIWLFTFMATAIYVINGGVTAFGPIIIRSMGYTPTRAILLQTPGGAVTVVAILAVALLSLRFSNARLILLCLSCLPVIIGAAAIWGSNWNNRLVPLVGYWLLPAFGAPYVMLLSILSANIAGSTKSTFASGAVFVGYNAGNIAAAYILKPTEAARQYPTTWAIIIAMMLLTILLAGGLAIIMTWENRKRDREGTSARRQYDTLRISTDKALPDLDPQIEADTEVGHVPEVAKEGEEEDGDVRSDASRKVQIELDRKDLTDKQNQAFRYVF